MGAGPAPPPDLSRLLVSTPCHVTFSLLDILSSGVHPPHPTTSSIRNNSLVGVRVVVVVLDAPGLKGVDEGREHERAHNVLNQVVLVEGAVAGVVANNEPLQMRWVGAREGENRVCGGGGEGKERVKASLVRRPQCKRVRLS